ncbi:hypothetical protein [Amycolatopsis sp. NPDC059657]|uniref:hypothetical protein n=1 Tax=Amycolatopsis sp. NPDC059657 TaxID=3346899 RepID=UPI00366AFDC3
MSTNPGPENWGQQPQQPPPGGGYPAAPPPPPHAPAALGPVPKSLELSIKLWFAAAGVFILRGILEIAVSQDVADETFRRFQVANPGTTATSTGASILGTIFTLILAAAWIGTVFAMRSGQNWARILLTVLGGIALLLGLVGLLALGIYFAVGGLAILSALLSVVSLVLIAGAILFQFKSDANAFFVRR